MRVLSIVSPIALAIGLSIGAGGVANSAACTDLLPAIPPAGGTKRALVADDLLRLRDIGSKSLGAPNDPILSLSPDGKSVAFQLRQADPDTDSYCLNMMVLPVAPGAKPIIVDRGGEYIRVRQEMGPVTNYPSGFTELITPVWSPDGKFIAYKRQDNGHIQAWVAAADGRGSRQVSHVDFDVEDLAWSADGHRLLVSGRPGLATALARIETEGETGFLLDERYIPFGGTKPFPLNDIPREVFSVDIENGQARPGTDAERAVLLPPPLTGVPDKAIQSAGGPANGLVAWMEYSDPQNVASPAQLHVLAPDGKSWTCAVSKCGIVRGFWWNGADALVFQTSDGWARSEVGIYQWDFRTAQVRRIIKTEDVLTGCRVGDGVLVCAHESSLQPREIVEVDLKTGALRSVFDPNPEIRSVALGPVKRLHTVNSFGVQGIADLVLPPGLKANEKVPLVVVQYISRGFLRGGVDDDFPIQLFATNGMAVLSFEDVLSPGSVKGGASWYDIGAYDRIDWRGHRSTQELLELAIKQSLDTGVIDGNHLGISGNSAGSTKTRWALLNSHLFSAAAVGSCCEDMTSIITTYGEAGANEMRRYGFPGLTDDGSAFWAPYSFLLNARRMKTPLLMQLPDHEYLAALESYYALREQNSPTEMYVFPDEFHEKWHPIHRRAVYERGLDWFKFWLMGQEDNNPAKQDQYNRWRSLRANLPGPGAPPGR